MESQKNINRPIRSISLLSFTLFKTLWYFHVFPNKPCLLFQYQQHVYLIHILAFYYSLKLPKQTRISFLTHTFFLYISFLFSSYSLSIFICLCISTKNKTKLYNSLYNIRKIFLHTQQSGPKSFSPCVYLKKKILSDYI